jgi:hypothetical protein
MGSGSRLKHHEGKLAPLCQQQGEHRALLKRQLHRTGQPVDNCCLDRQKAHHDGRHHARRLQQDAKVDAHAHRDEKDT